MTNIEPLLFNGLTKLETLFLQNNKLTRIDEGPFKTLTNLKSLLLESNNILTFDRNALIGLSNIELVCLSNNPISILGQSIIKDICKTSPRCLVQINGECDVYLNILNSMLNIR